jgi:hypothetical protein
MLHNCLIDSGATNTIIPLSVMKSLRMECTIHYDTAESIYVIESRKVMHYGEIKDLCAYLTATPHITTILTIVVIDLPPTYGVFLGRDWYSMIGGYIMNGRQCIMMLNKDGTMVRVPIEIRKHFPFKIKENKMIRIYLDDGMENYVVFDSEYIFTQDKLKEKNYFQGYWKMSFDGAWCKSGSGAGIIFKIHEDVIYPHAIILEFQCSNNEV